MSPVKIGCYSAFWGDSASAIKQFIQGDEPKLDYVVADYLAELTMGILARMESQSKRAYISEFLDLVLAPHLDLIIKKRIKIITNAGGLDPVGLKQAIEKHLKERNVDGQLRVAAVYGDNIVSQKESLLRDGAFENFDPLSGAGSSEDGVDHDSRLLSLNAYIGAEPITEALKKGADIIVTGRCVDSALVVGPLAYEYGWQYTTAQQDLNLLASASLAGHVIECGAQATGGNFTDWKQSAFSPHGGWSNMGYPILTFEQDGAFTISKPDQTGGLVTCNSVCEQMLYEVLDPENYVLPDVVLDMSQVRLEQTGPGIVTVRGAKGKPPTPWLKCTAVEQKGHRISVDILVCGDEAESKAKTLGKAMIDKTNAISKERFQGKVAPIEPSESAIMLIGNESSLGLSSRPERREVALRVAARHMNRQVLDILSKEAASFLTNSCPGICLLTSGRAKSSPCFVASSVLVYREKVVPKVQVTGQTSEISVPLFSRGCKKIEAAASRIQASSGGYPVPLQPSPTSVPLHHIAVGRSGDKGDTANIAIIARDPAYYKHILEQVTPEVIFSRFRHFITAGGTVTRFEVPGVSAVNFVLTRSLGGGGLSSLRLDRQAKSYAQLALATIHVSMPQEMILTARL